MYKEDKELMYKIKLMYTEIKEMVFKKIKKLLCNEPGKEHDLMATNSDKRTENQI